MQKQNEHLLTQLTDAPWWVSVVLSGVIYTTLTYLVPYFLSDASIVFQGLANGLNNAAIYLALIFLIPAPLSLLKRQIAKKRLSQTATFEHLQKLHWLDFEALVGEYYRQKGFNVSQCLNHAPDGGVDIALRKNGELHLVQCKHWKARKVGVKVLRELYGVMLDRQADRMIVVTSGDFTADAINFADAKQFELINGDQLLAIVGEIKPKTQSKTAQDIQPPTCPRCKSALVLRTAKQGIHIGKSFYGCSNFPKCRHIENTF
ncbi:restriction endonuclease [Enterovibrio paralichthyis]|uniref:restriction endonuclease n=1 Tax=Enterovibrio paralichthyis TaxID=2853805 RepID=UPI001C469132|nr:restriction endonuclease [Enterovibrio paralichthyis]MBV7300364.1 restriction endonuclease [Enterovibrio paralichthyis]